MPTTQQSYRLAAQVLGRAFADEPISKFIYRNFSYEKRVRALTVDFSAELVTCLQKGYPFQVVQDDRILAAALVYPPGTYPLPALDQWTFLVKSVLKNGWYNVKSWVEWLDEVDRVHPRQEHYYLLYIGVEPSFQGRGLGSCLLDHLVIMADKDGVGCYLETASPRSLPFYERAAFKVIGEKQIIGHPTWFMWREPATKPDLNSAVSTISMTI